MGCLSHLDHGTYPMEAENSVLICVHKWRYHSDVHTSRSSEVRYTPGLVYVRYNYLVVPSHLRAHLALNQVQVVVLAQLEREVRLDHR